MAIRYKSYDPDPILGQATLNNFRRTRRTLNYKGAGDVEATLRRGMPLYELEKKETVGENKDGNMFIRGECIPTCAFLKEQGIEVDLVYIDPPFASGADYAKKVYIRRNPQVAEAIAKAEEELETDNEFKKFEEKMYRDIWDKEKYLNWMYENLMAIKSVMSDTGSIYVHLDWHIGHYVKILLDEIFGEDNFINEIIWHYTGNSIPEKSFQKKHDTIFLYKKNIDFVLNLNDVLLPYSEATLKRYNHVDENGKRYKISALVKGKKEIVYAKEGKIPDSVWEIPVVRQVSEKVDYATQKPEALLERIIKASSNKGMIVADFFGGSGVTAAVASKLNRRFVHCDVGINSIQTARDRLVGDDAEFEILEIKDGISLYRNPIQTMEKLKSLIHGLKTEDSLDSFWEGAISDSKYGLMPVYVPDIIAQKRSILDEPMINNIIHNAANLISDIKKIIVYYTDVEDLNRINEYINKDDRVDKEIELRDLKEVLDDVVLEDYAEFHVNEILETLIKKYKVTIDKFLSDRVIQKIDVYNQKAQANANKRGKKFNPILISKNGLETIEYLSLDCANSSGVWHSDSEIKVDKLGYVILNGEKTKEFWDGAIKSEKKPLRLKIRNICGDETEWSLE